MPIPCSKGAKLSKRDNEYSSFAQVRLLRQAGYLPSSVMNWLTSTGTGGRGSSFSDDNADSPKHLVRWRPDFELDDLIARVSKLSY